MYRYTRSNHGFILEREDGHETRSFKELGIIVSIEDWDDGEKRFTLIKHGDIEWVLPYYVNYPRLKAEA